MDKLYNVDVSHENVKKSFASLKIVYDSMPKTSGCESCADINKENIHWCCKTIVPSAYYSEFLYAWEDVEKKWNKKDKLDLILRAIKNHITDNQKGCPFYNIGCSIYEKRFLQCRMYGIIPRKSWKKRVKNLKSIYGKDYKATPQCNLVKSDIYVDEKKENTWFEFSRICESKIGVSNKTIQEHDSEKGSYRAIHDHILMYCFSEDMLTSLSSIRLSKPTEKDIEDFLIILRRKLENVI